MNNADKHAILRILERAHMAAQDTSHRAVAALLPQGDGIRTISVDQGWMAYGPDMVGMKASFSTIEEGPEVAIAKFKAAIAAKAATA
jgi:hypothetical protein